jgi:hypothetical protein
MIKMNKAQYFPEHIQPGFSGQPSQSKVGYRYHHTDEIILVLVYLIITSYTSKGST